MLTPRDCAYQNFANAIITRAVEDYRNALKGVSYSRKSPKRIVKEIERFFRSKWFRELTAVDGEMLIEKLRQEHEEYERSNNESNADTSNAQPD